MLAELELIARDLEKNRQLLDQTVDGLTEAQMNVPVGEGHYSGKGILAHLAGAERGMTELVRRMVAGEQPRLRPDFDLNRYNTRHQEKRAGMTIAQLRTELAATRQDLLAFMETLTPQDLEKRGDHPLYKDATVKQVLEIIPAHELEHTQQLQRAALSF